MDFEVPETVQMAAAAAEPLLKLPQDEVWHRLVAADLVGLCINADHGGVGQGLLAASEVLRLCGRFGTEVPFASTAVVGALALQSWWRDSALSEVLDDIVRGRCLVANAVGEAMSVTAEPLTDTGRAGWSLSGVMDAIPDAEQANLLLVPLTFVDGTTAVAAFPLPMAGLSMTRQAAIHGGPVARIEFDEVELARQHLLGAEPQDWSLAHRWVLNRTQLSLCALQLGIMEHILELTAGYVGRRQQFGRSLGSFQAVALRLADAHIATEAVRAHVWRAAWMLDEGHDATTAVHMARLWTARSARDLARTGHQLHGGTGVDLDYPLHRLTRRSTWLTHRLGGAPAALRELGRAVASGQLDVCGDGQTDAAGTADMREISW